MHRILIIDRSKKARQQLTRALAGSYEIEAHPPGDDVFEHLKKIQYNVLLLDWGVSNGGSLDLLKWVKNHASGTVVIMTGRVDDAENVVNAIKRGASDFLSKPFRDERVRLAVRQALNERSLKNEIDYLRRQQDIVYDFSQIIAVSPSMKRVIKALKKFARTDATLLVTGETGTGKSFLSGTIHFNSHRRRKPFIKVNCANIPETLLESELFGHEKGSFTGATKQRIGRFEQADGGTLFLDEIGEMSLALQAKMLRFLEEKCFERVGGNSTIHTDARVIAATNRNLEKLTETGQFREDLYYRINVLSVNLPPLRERRQCIEPLAHAILQKVSRNLKKRVDGFSPAIVEWFKSYDWPGNIRQLSNTIERAVILTDEPVIQEEHVAMLEPMLHRQPGRPESPTTAAPSGAPKSLKDAEKEMILEALEKSLWIQKDAAKLLGISPRALIYKIKKFGITHHRWRKNR